MSTETAPTPSQIQDLQKELFEKQAQLSRWLRAAPPEPVDDVVFQGPDGPVALSALFGDKPDLIAIHNMGARCPYCTMWADGFQGLLPHLQDRAAFVLLSADTPDAQAAFAASRGWSFPMASTAGTTFTEDMGFRGEHDGQTMDLPGYSTFRKQADGTIVRIAKDSFGPGDRYNGAWHMFDLLEGGRGEWHARFTYE